MSKVFISGCFDLLHSGHVAFIEEAATHGDVYVGLGSDRTIAGLKGRPPVNNEQERLYMMKALRDVRDAWINSGSGVLDFVDDMKRLAPDILFVNQDGFSLDKEKLCRELGVRIVVSNRVPHAGLPARSTTAYRQECRIPYRIDLAGGWLDQPAVSKLAPGPVLTLSLEPDIEFYDLAGMATSTRKMAIELWGSQLPPLDPVKMGRNLFCYENPPGKRAVSGSQDSLGITLPGLNRLHYDNDFWPASITPCRDDSVLAWLERHLSLVFIKQRAPGFDPYRGCDIAPAKAAELARAAEACWHAALAKDFGAFATAFYDSFKAQVAMFPATVTPEVEEVMERRKGQFAGCKLAGAGGGGYMILAAERPPADSIPIRARRDML